MITMKCDMAGAAAVAQATLAIARLGIPVRITAYLALAENMPSGTAQRPGDILTTYNGTTVEVLNTDAEGRLIMADALSRACEDSPDLLVDVATLTGAQIVALGSHVGAAMGTRTRATGLWPQPPRPASSCGRCRFPRSCARRWTPRSPTSPTSASGWAG